MYFGYAKVYFLHCKNIRANQNEDSLKTYILVCVLIVLLKFGLYNYYRKVFLNILRVRNAQKKPIVTVQNHDYSLTAINSID